MTRSFNNQVLALAGIFQSARLVQLLAREGRMETEAFQASIQSILAIDADSVDAVYGGIKGVRLGLDLLANKLGGHSGPSDVEMARYVVSLMHLEGLLRRRPDMLEAVRNGIDTAQNQMKFFEAGNEGEAIHPMLIEKLADLYTQTISTLGPRIMVSGEHGHLANPAIAAKVRAVLLAGIRSAVLWRQTGGQRWRLLFSRGRIARTAAVLLASETP